MSARRVILHIGAHKTASSLLQSVLRTHTEMLQHDGLQVLHRSQLMDSPFHAALWATESAEDAQREIPPAVQDWLATAVPQDAPTLLLSNEDFFNRPSTPDFFGHIGHRLAFVQRCFPQAELAVILYTRSQADYVESLYMQHVHVGRMPKFPVFVERFADADLSWARVADEIAAVVGLRNTKVAPYESIKRIGDLAFYREFLRRCGIAEPSRYAFDPSLARSRGANRSYSALAMQIAARVYPLLDKPEERALLRRFLQENFSNVTHPRAVLFTPEQRAAFLGRFHEGNMRLFDVHMPDWPEERALY